MHKPQIIINMAQTIFIYPSGGQGPQSSNPYVQNMKDSLRKYYNVLQPTYKKRLPRMLVFLLNSFKADIYILNWIEDSAAARGGMLGGILSMLGLFIVSRRRAKLVWIFHNIHPHNGETHWSKYFRRFLFKHCFFIVAHSQEAANYAKSFSSCPVFFKNHPIKKQKFKKWEGEVQQYDFLIWSDILSYKGVPEFVENPIWKQSKKKLLIIGKSENEEIRKRIELCVNENITYEDRFAPYSEISSLCKKSKYVLFPYIGDSISSSGVLMDTLLMGGTPVGPNRGAFADLATQKCCIIYNNIDEVFFLPDDNKLDQKEISKFIKENTWEAFGLWLHKKIDN